MELLPVPSVASAPMTTSDEPYFPNPPDPARRFGFIVGDVISTGVILLVLSAIIKV